MKQKLLISIFVSIIALQFATAQPQGERIPTTEVIRLVSDAQAKHNAIYNERIKGHEAEQADFRKAIYSANTELMAIRSLLAGRFLSVVEGQACRLRQAAEATRRTHIRYPSRVAIHYRW